MFPCSLKQGSCSLVPYDIFPLFLCSPKPLGDPHYTESSSLDNLTCKFWGFHNTIPELLIRKNQVCIWMITLKVPMARNFFIILFERAFKMMKNGVYFTLIALLIAELFKILIYGNCICVTSQKEHKVLQNLSRLFLYRIETEYSCYTPHKVSRNVYRYGFQVFYSSIGYINQSVWV